MDLVLSDIIRTMNSLEKASVKLCSPERDAAFKLSLQRSDRDGCLWLEGALPYKEVSAPLGGTMVVLRNEEGTVSVDEGQRLLGSIVRFVRRVKRGIGSLVCIPNRILVEVRGSPLTGGGVLRSLSGTAIALLVGPVRYFAYGHEIAHLVLGAPGCRWLSEGLACYINDAYRGDKCYPNFGQRPQSLIACMDPKVVEAAVSEISDWQRDDVHCLDEQENRAFYLCAYSLTDFLVRTSGFEQVIKAYDNSRRDGLSTTAFRSSFRDLLARWTTRILCR